MMKVERQRCLKRGRVEEGARNKKELGDSGRPLCDELVQNFTEVFPRCCHLVPHFLHFFFFASWVSSSLPLQIEQSFLELVYPSSQWSSEVFSSVRPLSVIFISAQVERRFQLPTEQVVGILDDQWKFAVHKSKNCQDSTIFFRPIAILSVFGKCVSANYL